MLAILAENLKLILLLFMIATIVGLSWFGNERLMTASRSIHQRRIEMRERKVRFSKSSVRKKKAPKLTRIDASSR